MSHSRCAHSLPRRPSKPNERLFGTIRVDRVRCQPTRDILPPVLNATGKAITAAAIDLFFKHGYEAATLRDVADKVGLKVASLYNYIPSKQQLLFTIMYDVMQDLRTDVEHAVADQRDPVHRLSAAVRTHVRFHASRTKEVFIGNSELRSLTPRNRQKIIRQRVCTSKCNDDTNQSDDS